MFIFLVAVRHFGMDGFGFIETMCRDKFNLMEPKIPLQYGLISSAVCVTRYNKTRRDAVILA